MLLEGEIITLILSQNYDSNISRQLLNSFKTLTILSILWGFNTFKIQVSTTCVIIAMHIHVDIYESFNKKPNIVDPA